MWRLISHIERIALLVVLLGKAAWALEPVARKVKHKYMMKRPHGSRSVAAKFKRMTDKIKPRRPGD